MTYFGIPAWLAMNGRTATEIGAYVAVIGIPWSFKMLIAPFMDRYSYLPMGRRRPWVIFGQLGLFLAFIGLAMVPQPLAHMDMLMTAGFLVSLFSAVQDVAVDGLAIDIVPVDEQARVSAFQWGARIIGVSFSMAVGSWLLNQYGFKFSILSLAAAICVAMIIPLLFRERPGERAFPWTPGKPSPDSPVTGQGGWPGILKALGKVLILPNSLLLALIAFLNGTAVSYMNTLLPVFTVQSLGWTNESFSNTNAMASVIGGIVGVTVGGVLVDKFGKVRMMSVYLVMGILLAVVMFMASSHWQTGWVGTSFIIAYNVVYVFMMVGFFAIAMGLCWKRISASQFTFYMAISNFGWVAGSALIGVMKERFNWEICILAFSFFAFLVLIPLQWMKTNNHLLQLAALECGEQQNEALAGGTSTVV